MSVSFVDGQVQKVNTTGGAFMCELNSGVGVGDVFYEFVQFKGCVGPEI